MGAKTENMIIKCIFRRCDVLVPWCESIQRNGWTDLYQFNAVKQWWRWRCADKNNKLKNIPKKFLIKCIDHASWFAAPSPTWIPDTGYTWQWLLLPLSSLSMFSVYCLPIQSVAFVHTRKSMAMAAIPFLFATLAHRSANQINMVCISGARSLNSFHPPPFAWFLNGNLFKLMFYSQLGIYLNLNCGNIIRGPSVFDRVRRMGLRGETAADSNKIGKKKKNRRETMLFYRLNAVKSSANGHFRSDLLQNSKRD